MKFVKGIRSALLAIAVAAAVLVALSPPLLAQGAKKLAPELQRARDALDKYKDPIVAVHDGYWSTVGCVNFPKPGGHGTVPFTKADISAGRVYLEYLRDQVQAAMSRGESLEQMKKSITLEPYRSWRHFETLRPFNIEAAYRNLTTYK